MESARNLIRRETIELPATYEPAFLQALADGDIRTQRGIERETDIPREPIREIPSELLQPSFWGRATSLHQAMRSPDTNEYWHFEVNYTDLLEWLKPTNRKTSSGRPPDNELWETFWIEAVLLANLDGLPDTQAKFIEHVAQRLEDTRGSSPSETMLKEKARKIYSRLQTKGR